MLSKNQHEYWFGAKHEAIELSNFFGWAWVIRDTETRAYRVAAGELNEERPQDFIAEFKDGYEQ